MSFSPGDERRVALVIGNGAYEDAGALTNPTNDARGMAAALRRLGFDVDEGIDLDFSAMRRKLRDFGRMTRMADIGLIFYAGHGLQVKGENYLLPVNVCLEHESDLDYETVQLDLVIRETAQAKRLSVIILDACRNNPFERRFRQAMEAAHRSAMVGRGLARINRVPHDTLIAFATAADDVADDGDGPNSPFTTALLAYVEEPDLEISFLFRKVRDAVLSSTGNRQGPAVYSSLGAIPFYFCSSSQGRSNPEHARLGKDRPDQSSLVVEQYQIYQYPRDVHPLILRACIVAREAASLAVAAQQRARNIGASAAAERGRQATKPAIRVQELSEDITRNAEYAYKGGYSSADIDRFKVRGSYETEIKQIFADFERKGRRMFGDSKGTLGEFLLNEVTGTGVRILGRGERYEGEFDKGNLVIGMHTKSDGSRYEGTFQNGQWTGFGICSVEGITYEGNFKNGQIVGHGVHVLENGGRYEGEFHDGVKSGYGVYSFSNGDRYEGEFYADAMTGYGALFRADGGIEQGIWRNNELVNAL